MNQRIVFVAMIVIWTSFRVCGQAKTEKPTGATKQQHAQSKTLGSISGRVFLITEAGDLKPARFANVYLMSQTSDKSDNSASMVFLEKETEQLQSGLTTTIPEAKCLEYLLWATNSVQAAATWAQENKEYYQFTGANTDEDGAFRITGIVLSSRTGQSLRALNPGTKIDGFVWNYTVVVRGRAGANEAYWNANARFLQINGKFSWSLSGGDLQPGTDISMKLGSPETACLVMAR
ncbi:MAG: hypothetical protein JWQ49_3117 [Edaphobacter sp.]|nr:hypothetical protein [Edaphobacter sp.]